MPASVALGFCTAGRPTAEFMMSVVRLLLRDATGPGHIVHHGAVLDRVSGPLIHISRNMIAHNFLEHTTADWLLMMDDDIVFPSDVVERMLLVAQEEGIGVLSGLYYARNITGKINPVMYHGVDPIVEWEPNTLVDVTATGCGCMLVRRWVLEQIVADDGPLGHLPANQRDWFQFGRVGEADYGEDFWFCSLARRAGFRVVVDTSLQLGHVKTHVVTESDWIGWRTKEQIIGTEAAVAEGFAKIAPAPLPTVVHDDSPRLSRAERRRLARQKR